MEDNDKLVCIHSEGPWSDCTSHYIYEPRERVTVQELCDYALSNPNDFGVIQIRGDRKHCVHYNRGKYDNTENKNYLPPEILNAYIKRVNWDGGWGQADWTITLEGYEEPKPVANGPFDACNYLEDDTFEDEDEKIEQRIKNMTNEELERYILEARARKLMKEK